MEAGGHLWRGGPGFVRLRGGCRAGGTPCRRGHADTRTLPLPVLQVDDGAVFAEILPNPDMPFTPPVNASLGLYSLYMAPKAVMTDNPFWRAPCNASDNRSDASDGLCFSSTDARPPALNLLGEHNAISTGLPRHLLRVVLKCTAVGAARGQMVGDLSFETPPGHFPFEH